MRLTTDDVLAALAARRTDEIVLPTMTAAIGWIARGLGPLDLPVVGAMGSAAAIGLGLALAQPTRRIWVLDGDGSLLMQLGALATIGALAPPNFVHLVIANGVYAFTGGQPLPLAPAADLPTVARALGYRAAWQVDQAATLAAVLDHALRATGPVFLWCVVAPPVGARFDVSQLPPMAARGQALRALLAQAGEERDHDPRGRQGR
jgi:phosphonopyruvate decarboxylase